MQNIVILIFILIYKEIVGHNCTASELNFVTQFINLKAFRILQMNKTRLKEYKDYATIYQKWESQDISGTSTPVQPFLSYDYATLI
jgi:hypothetical protein